jgi:Glycosyltransferase family 87
VAQDPKPPRFTSRIETWATLIAIGFTLFEVRSHWPNNFLIFRTATEHLLRGSDLYVAYPERHFDLFKYSPTFALVFWPFAALPMLPSLLLWNSASAWVFARSLRAVIPDTPGQICAGLMLLWPFLTQLSGAQTNALVAALMIAAVVAMEEHRPEASALAITTGAVIKLFPLAAAPLALTQRRRTRFLVTTVLSGILFIVAPLIAVKPHVLAAEYSSWYRIEAVDALDRGYSVMGVLHEWLGLDWPNWPVQLVGTTILLLPLLLRRERWGERTFRRQMLASVLIYVVLFNHQAEYRSYLIAAAGFVIWFLWSRRTLPAAIVTALAMSALHPFPYFFAWMTLQFQLLGNSPRERGERDVLAAEPLAYS